MRNPFARPRTPGQWLLGSACWTVACLGSWLLADRLLVAGYPAADGSLGLAFGCFGLAHILIWRRAVDGFRLVLEAPKISAFMLVPAVLWWLALLLTQVACLLLVPLWYAFLSAGNSGTPWLQF